MVENSKKNLFYSIGASLLPSVILFFGAFAFLSSAAGDFPFMIGIMTFLFVTILQILIVNLVSKKFPIARSAKVLILIFTNYITVFVILSVLLAIYTVILTLVLGLDFYPNE